MASDRRKAKCCVRKYSFRISKTMLCYRHTHTDISKLTIGYLYISDFGSCRLLDIYSWCFFTHTTSLTLASASGRVRPQFGGIYRSWPPRNTFWTRETVPIFFHMLPLECSVMREHTESRLSNCRSPFGNPQSPPRPRSSPQMKVNNYLHKVITLCFSDVLCWKIHSFWNKAHYTNAIIRRRSTHWKADLACGVVTREDGTRVSDLPCRCIHDPMDFPHDLEQWLNSVFEPLLTTQVNQLEMNYHAAFVVRSNA